jgi:hypothetical protein
MLMLSRLMRAWHCVVVMACMSAVVAAVVAVAVVGLSSGQLVTLCKLNNSTKRKLKHCHVTFKRW